MLPGDLGDGVDAVHHQGPQGLGAVDPTGEPAAHAHDGDGLRQIDGAPAHDWYDPTVASAIGAAALVVALGALGARFRR